MVCGPREIKLRPIIILALLAAVAAAEDVTTLPVVTNDLLAALDGGVPSEATAALVAIQGIYPKGAEAEQKGALKAIGKAAKSKDLQIRHGAFAALATLKVKGSSKYLGRWLKPPKRFKGEIPISYTEAIRAAGAIADPATLANLRKLADHQDLDIGVPATTALGGFRTLPTKRRKGLAIDLVDRLKRLTAKQRRKWSPEVSERKEKLATATVTALKALTGVDRTTPAGWERWKEKAEKKANPFPE